MSNQNKNNENDSASEEFNKELLKQTVFTFSKEGISNDLKYFIQKKVAHNKTNLCYLTQLMDLSINSETEEITELAFKKGSPLKNLMEHVYSEIVRTDELIDRAIEFVISKDPEMKKFQGLVDGK